MAVDIIGAMKEQKQQAESKTNGNGFLLFSIRDKQRALVRPLVNLDHCDKVDFHRFFDPSTNRYVEAVCANTIGKLCLHCENRKNAESKRLQDVLLAKECFMLPLWLLGIQQKQLDPDTQTEILDENDNPIWELVTYTDKTTEKEVPVNGLRIIPLAFKRSAYSSIADAFLKMHEAGEKIVARDFLIERQGGDQTTKYNLSKKQPSQFKIDIGDAPRTQEAIRTRVLEAFPVVPVGGSTNNAVSNEDESNVDHPF